MRSQARLSLALTAGHLQLPDTGRIAVFAPRAGQDLSFLPQDRVEIVTGSRPDFNGFSALGYNCTPEVGDEAGFAAAIVFLPRARDLAHMLIHKATQITDGPVVVDGAKQDGVEAILRACRKLTRVSEPFSKAHGKVFTLSAGTWCPADWQGGAAPNADGFMTAPGVFSADAIDPASRLLADHLPADLTGRVADLGAGWGYLSAHVLASFPGVKTLDLVEADKLAIDCAARNIADKRAVFHWRDALDWRPEAAVDHVVMNPPFHIGREASPDLGRGFIRAAAQMLTPRGHLWMVANRHLPYEADLSQCFAELSEPGGDKRFKLFHATRPYRKKR